MKINVGEVEQRLRRFLGLRGPSAFELPETIEGYICLDDLRDQPWRTEPIKFAAPPSVGGVAAQISHVGVRNPANSRRLVVVDEAIVAFSVAGTVQLNFNTPNAVTDAFVATTAHDVDNLVTQPLSAPQSLQGTNAVAQGIAIGLFILPANTGLRVPVGVVLHENEELFFLSQTVLNNAAAYFIGRVFADIPQ